MPQYCLVKHHIVSSVIDGPDLGNDPDTIPISGDVTFYPILDHGDSVVVTDGAEKISYILAPISARIVQGKISVNGEEGVKLFAGGPDTNPERIRYRAKFTGLNISGVKRINLKDILFEAIPGGEVYLSMAQPVPGAPYPGYSATIEQGLSQIESARDEALGQVSSAVSAEAGSIRWIRPPLTGSDNADTLPSGLSPVPTPTVATALGLPIVQPGELVTTWLDTSGVRRRQTFYADPTTGSDAGLNIFRRWYYNGKWQPWQLAVKPITPYYRGAVPAGVTPEDMTGSTYQGLWSYSSGQVSEWSVPSKAAGMLEVSSSGASTLHQVVTLTTPIRNFQRRWYNGTWSGDWEELGGSSTPVPDPVPVPAEVDEYATATSKNALNLLVPSTIDPTLTYETDHAALVADLKTRIGPVTTGGKAAVALVADHGTTAFKEWVWAAAKARNIPFTMALAPEIHLDGKGDSRHQATNEDIQQWVSEGLAIASHSGDHGGALGYFDVARQIVTSKKKLEEKLGTTVDAWVQPGYVLADGNYDGFGTGQSASRYTDYYAGRLLQQTYPVITGYAGDNFVYPGDADLPVGVRRSLMERKDAYQGVKDHIQQAIDTGGKHVNFLHPYAIPESSTTYVTRSEYLAFLDWLVQKRDAGELVLLTLPELAIARP